MYPVVWDVRTCVSQALNGEAGFEIDFTAAMCL